MTFTNNDWWRDAVAHSAMPMETATVISKA